MSPDEAAAGYAPAPTTWKGRPVPEVGRTVKIRHRVQREWTTTVGTVKTAGVVGGGTTLFGFTPIDVLLIALTDGRTVDLHSNALFVDWQYAGTDADTASVPEHVGIPGQARPMDDATDLAENEITPFDAFDEDGPTVEPPAPEVPTANPTNMVELLRRGIYLSNRKKELKAELAAVEEEAGKVSEAIIADMLEQGIDRPPAVDGMTASVYPVFYVEKNTDPETGESFETPDVVAALDAIGLSHMATRSYNGNSLKALLKEFENSEDGVPEALARVVTLGQRPEIRFTRAAAATRRNAPRAKRT